MNKYRLNVGMHMNMVSLIMLAVLGFYSPAKGQSASELRAKYPIITAYEVRPGVLMTAKYASDGQVCEMTLERRHTTKSGINLDTFLPEDLVKVVVDELVPLSSRGKHLVGVDNWFGSVTIVGSLVIVRDDYENVSILTSEVDTKSGPSGKAVVTIRWRKRLCTEEDRQAAASTGPHDSSVHSGSDSRLN